MAASACLIKSGHWVRPYLIAKIRQILADEDLVRDWLDRWICGGLVGRAYAVENRSAMPHDMMGARQFTKRQR